MSCGSPTLGEFHDCLVEAWRKRMCPETGGFGSVPDSLVLNPVVPKINSPAQITTEEGGILHYQATVSEGTNVPGCVLVWSLVGAPSWITIDAVTGHIHVNPVPDETEGLYNIDLVATNCVGSTTLVLGLRVGPVEGAIKIWLGCSDNVAHSVYTEAMIKALTNKAPTSNANFVNVINVAGQYEIYAPESGLPVYRLICIPLDEVTGTEYFQSSGFTIQFDAVNDVEVDDVVLRVFRTSVISAGDFKKSDGSQIVISQ